MAPSNLRIIWANCQGLRDINKRTDVLNYFADIRPDILCLQDTHWLSEDKKLIKTLWAGECLLNGSQTNARGVAILINKTFEYKIISVERDISGNLISASLYPQTKVGDILDSGPSRRRRRRNFLVDAITQKQINIFFSNLVHMLRLPKGRSLF